jgi:hypothetical protein
MVVHMPGVFAGQRACCNYAIPDTMMVQFLLLFLNRYFRYFAGVKSKLGIVKSERTDMFVTVLTELQQCDHAIPLCTSRNVEWKGNCGAKPQPLGEFLVAMSDRLNSQVSEDTHDAAAAAATSTPVPAPAALTPAATPPPAPPAIKAAASASTPAPLTAPPLTAALLQEAAQIAAAAAVAAMKKEAEEAGSPFGSKEGTIKTLVDLGSRRLLSEAIEDT